MNKTPWYKSDTFMLSLAIVMMVMAFSVKAAHSGLAAMLVMIMVVAIICTIIAVPIYYVVRKIEKDDREYETVKEDPFPGILYQVHKTTGKRRWTIKRGPKPDINMDWVMGKTDEL